MFLKFHNASGNHYDNTNASKYPNTTTMKDYMTYFFAFLVTTLIGVVLYYKWSFTYWKKRGLEFLEPSIPFGNTTKLFLAKSSIAEQFAEFYEKFKAKGLKHGGVYMFAQPYYIPVDPIIIKNILQNDFSHFYNRGFYVNEIDDPLSGHLFSLQDSKWKNLRTKLTATFTSGKMKMMFDTIAKCAQNLDTKMSEAAARREVVDVKDVLALYTIDVISSCAFGLESNSLKNPNSPFAYYGKRIFRNSTWESMKNFAQLVFPHWFLTMIKFRTTKRDVEEFLMGLVKQTVNYREKNNIYQKDFLHLLLQLKNRGKIADDGAIFEKNGERQIGLTMNELTAQVFVFFAAGFETSSTAMSFTLYELALNQELQNKLRKEIDEILKKHNNEITYDAIMEMTFMDKVIKESLRKYPPVGFVIRQCTKPYHVPNTTLLLENGTMVMIPILGLHNDPEYYPEPSKFDPERFDDKNKSSQAAFTWIPFGEGPRICIGLRFALLQTKIGLATLLKNYKITLNSKTPQPFIMDKKALTHTTQSGIWIDVSNLKKLE